MSSNKALRILGVVGSGQMGSGIAQLAAQANMDVILCDMNESALKNGMSSIENSLSRFVRKGTISIEDTNSTLSRIKTTLELREMEEADVVVEAVSEDESLKKVVFTKLDKIVSPKTILASNTSSISISRLARVTNRPQQVIGMHFMNPPQLMKLVEVVRGFETSDEVYNFTMDIAKRMGKEVITSKDYPGFVVNRVLMPMINEAFFALQEGVATAEDIDMGMKLGTNHPMGPLALADTIGLDTCLSIMTIMHDGFRDSKYRPCPLLVQYVDAGLLGRKTGRGVYSYSENP